MCRALEVLCVAPDDDALAQLKRAAVSADWELSPGATDADGALRQLHVRRPHVLVVFGAFDDLVERALEAFPSLRVVSDRDLPGAVRVHDVDGVRSAIARPWGGPVRQRP